MFSICYLIRLDDASPTMDRGKWNRIEGLLERYKIHPMVGIIPHNEDPKQSVYPEDPEFWNKVLQWKNKGWAIALHGYNHCYSSDCGLKGLNPMWRRSEFAGLSLDEQKYKIRKGVSILLEHGLEPEYFFAPSHTFDQNTLVALYEESKIRVISDTVATQPYRYEEFFFIPQFGGRCREMWLPGVFTFCFHPNSMNDRDFEKLEVFLSKHKGAFISFDSLDLKQVGGMSLFDRLLSWAFFKLRKYRGLK